MLGWAFTLNKKSEKKRKTHNRQQKKVRFKKDL